MSLTPEILDIVDQHDRIIGAGQHATIHQTGQYHRCAHLFITNQQSEVFIQQRATTKKQFPGKWDVAVAGHVTSGESYTTCIKRECQEELGVNSNHSLRWITKVTPSASNGFEFVGLFHMEHAGPFTLNPIEIIQGTWISPQKLKQWLNDAPDDFTSTFLPYWLLLVQDLDSK